MSPSPDPAPARAPARPAAWPALAALAVLTGLALALRLWRLAEIPPGFHVDEAFNVLDARAVMAGARPIFLPSNAGREVLYTYLQTVTMGLFGDSLAAARAASAAAGALAVPATWWAARGLAPSRPRAAWLAAVLAATSYWALHFGRFGIRAVLFTPVAALAVGAWARVLAAQDPADRRRWALAAGACLGAAFYVHPAGRGLWLVPAAHAAWRAAWRRDGAPLRALATGGAVALAVAAPLLAWWARHPGTATGHAAEVGILGAGLGALMQNAAAVGGMFFARGDPAPWRNLPGRAVFDPLVGIGFVTGLGVAAHDAWRGRAAGPGATDGGGGALALLWLLGLAAPSILADAAPNFSRAIGALPAACVVAALGLDALARLWPRPRANLLLALILGMSAVWSTRDYFLRWAADPSSALAFDEDLRAVAAAADGLVDAGQAVFLAPATADHATVRASARHAPVGVDPARGLVLRAAPGGGAAATYLFVPRLGWDVAAERALLERTAAADALLGPLARRPAFRAAEEDPLAPTGWSLATASLPSASLATWEAEGLALLGADLAASIPPGATAPARLLWRAGGPTDRPLTLAVHLVDLTGRRVAQADGPPLGGWPATDRWAAGDLVLVDLALEVAPDAARGPAHLAVGWYAQPAAADEGLDVRRSSDGADLVTVAETRIAFGP